MGRKTNDTKKKAMAYALRKVKKLLWLTVGVNIFYDESKLSVASAYAIVILII